MPTCFVIQPFDPENDRRYEEVYKPALEQVGLEPYRVDQDPTVEVPIESIEKRIRNSAICLADITEDNLSVSNSSSGRRWKLDHAPAVGDPTHMVEFGTGHRAFAREA